MQYCTNILKITSEIKTLPPFYAIKATGLKLAYIYILHLDTQTDYQMYVLQVA